MFWRRALVFFTLVPLGIFIIYLGGWYYVIAFGALLLIAAIEFSQLSKVLGWLVPLAIFLPSVIAQWILPADVMQMLFGTSLSEINLVAPALAISSIAILIFSLWLYERRIEEDAPGSWMAGIGGLILLGWFGSHFFRLRAMYDDAWDWTILVIATIWITDTGAYVFGKTIGRHKLSPRLSPNKTIEGYVGGIVFGTITAVLLAYFFDLGIWRSLILGILISVIAPVGDLGVSMIKRSVGAKHSGNLLPGHGGALDRTDSLLVGIVLAYYYIQITN